MPIYEFRCKNCHHVFEELVFSSLVNGEDLVCPACGEKNAEKLMSAFSSAGTGSNGYSASSAPSCGGSGFS
jgi:putative FmdB family regulatory protein